jgi:4'-phosphopantetheinyl transferase
VTGRASAAKAMPGDTPGDTHVWIVDLAALGARLVAIETARRLLTASERTRADSIADASLRARWIAAHVALHLALGEQVGRPVMFEPAGPSIKPRVAGWAGDFSLSHSGDLVLIAIGERTLIGVDAEVRRPVRIGAERRRLIEVAGAACLPGEPLPVDDAEMRFLAAWTRLEAIGKMRGTGIGALLATLGIVARGPGAETVAERARQLVADDARPIAIASIDVARFDAVASLATSPPAGADHLCDLSAELARLEG